MSNYLITVAMLIFLTGCNNKQFNKTQNSYKVVELAEAEDCKVYAMIFEKGNDYLFRYAQSGECNNMDSISHLLLYESFLKKNLNSFKASSSKKIIIEIHDFAENLRDSIIRLTETNLNIKSTTISHWNDGIEIFLEPANSM